MRAALGHAWRALSAIVCAAALVSCGGGGEGGTQAGVGSGGTGSYSSGSISAFGSIVVNGTHYNHEAVGVNITAVDPDGTSRVLRASDLKLGMTIEVDEAPSTKVNGVKQAGALTMRVRSDLIGPVTDVNTAAGTFKVLGQLVHVEPGTRLANADGTDYVGVLSGLLANGDLVEVYGHQEAETLNQAEYIATRVERKLPGSVNQYVLRGVVDQLNLDTGTCKIGAARVAYLNTITLPDGLAKGRVARVTLDLTPPTGGVYMGQGIKLTDLLQADRPNATLAGLVTKVTSDSARQFDLNGIPVDAAPAHCPGCTMPQLGQRLRVQGDLVGGTLQATSVSPITTGLP